MVGTPPSTSEASIWLVNGKLEVSRDGKLDDGFPASFQMALLWDHRSEVAQGLYHPTYHYVPTWMMKIATLLESMDMMCGMM